jgi:hypothetical protein
MSSADWGGRFDATLPKSDFGKESFNRHNDECAYDSRLPCTELSDKRVFGGREIEVLAQFLIE